MEKKNLMGKKVRGFEFQDEALAYGIYMDNYVGSIGTISSVYETSVGVTFPDGEHYYYPLSEIEKHLVDDTPSQYEVGMTVYDYEFGKGEVVGTDSGSKLYPVLVLFNGESNFRYYTKDGKYTKEDKNPRLSLTPYDLANGGATFPTFKPKLPEIEKGTLVFVKTGSMWHMRFFSHFDDSGNIYCFINQEKSGKADSWPEYSLTNPLIDEKER